MNNKLFDELNSYVEKCRIFTHAKDAIKFIKEKY